MRLGGEQLASMLRVMVAPDLVDTIASEAFVMQADASTRCHMSTL